MALKSEQNPQGEFQMEEDIKMPSMYRVLLHNDDYTTMEFVVLVLVDIFHKNAEMAADIMLHVHQKGVGECGVFTKEIAESKVHQVRTRAKKANFPLLCTMEEVSS